MKKTSVKSTAMFLAAMMTASFVPVLTANAETREINAYVNTFEDKQTIVGVGGGITWYNDWLTTNPNKAEIYDLLFNKVGLDVIRIKNFYDYDGITFNPGADKENIESAEKAAGKELPVLMSSWSPSGKVKSNGVYQGGGTIKKNEDGSYAYDEYAQYYKEALEAYRDAGVKIDYFSIQNEPDFKADYDGCELDPEENENHASYAKAFDAVYEAFQDVEDPPIMVGPDSMTASYTNIKKYIQPILDHNDGRLGAIAHHLYVGGSELDPDQYKKSMNKLRDNYPDIPKWQTEYYRGNGIQTAWLITNVFVEEGAEAYIYWDTIWGPDGTLVALENPWEQSSWTTEKGYTVNDKIYALEHFAAFTDGGYVLVDSSVDPDAQDIKMAAFNSPEKDKLEIVLTNTEETDADVKLNLNGYEITSSTVYRTVYSEGGTERMADIGELNDDLTVSLPAQSIITVDITGKQGAKPETILEAEEPEPFQSLSAVSSYGTPVIDGEIDEIWDAVPETSMINAAHGDHGASATFKTMWDEKALYVLMNVTDENLDDTAANEYEQDSVEVFINESNEKNDAYDDGDAQYRVNYKNVQSYGTGGSAENIVSATSETETGYIVEMAISFQTITPENGTKIGFDAQVNDSHGNGERNYILKWSDPTDNTWGNLEDIGTLELVKQEQEKPDKITVTVDGENVVFADQEPVIIGDRVMIPLRAVAETTGKTVDWDEASRTVIISSSEEAQTVNETNDGTVKVYVDGNKISFADQEPVIMNDRTMVPLRGIAEALGMDVEWDENSYTVIVTKK